jgi:aspartyl/glutamyl-tRNA(Asn/Gln) amidotransferase C subunit
MSTLNVPHLARLARLALPEERAAHLQTQLDGVVQYVDKLAQANAGMPSHDAGLQNVVAVDEVHHFPNTAAILAGVPRTANNLIMVRAVSLDEGASA